MSVLSMPRTHNSETPVSNRPISNHILARNQERHLRELYRISAKNIRHNNLNNHWGSTSRTKNEPVYTHLRNNPKRLQIQDDRFVEIERENRLLLQKMSALLSTDVVSPDAGTMEFAPGVRLNKFQLPVIDHGISVNPSFPQPGQARPPESLNREARRREFERITRENRGIVSRIQGRTTYYPNRHWEEHSREHDRLLSLSSRPTVGSVGSRIGFAGQPSSPLQHHKKMRSRPSTVSTLQPVQPELLSGASARSALVRTAAPGEMELLVGLAAGFCAGQTAVLRPGEDQEEHVEVFNVMLRRSGVALLLARALQHQQPMGSIVIAHAHEPARPLGNCLPTA
jgi:hypothetical protein